ncbi:MAG: hypothetical protein ACR2HV_06070 [Acidimicrobiales bacterium]
MSYSTDPSHSNDAPARRILLLFAASLVAVGLGGLVFVSVNKESFDDTSPVAGSAAPAGVGPEAGVDIAGYVDGRAAALADASGERTAVVSFPEYMSDAQARATVGGAQVVSVLAAVPGGLPAVVNGDMAGWVNGQVAEKRSERDEIRQLLPTVDDPQFKSFYQQEIDRLDGLLEGVDSDGPLVFGVVVRAPSSDLQALATKPQVRLVDVGPSATLKANTPIRGLRPEETVRANDPPTRPV